MKNLILLSTTILSLLLVFSCSKEPMDKDYDKDSYACKDKKDYDKKCTKGDKKGCNKGKADYTKIVVEPIQKSADCDCIVGGLIKYVENGKTTALVNYGDGTCDNLATKTSCYDGDCEHAKATVHEFEMDCNKEDNKGS
ncbi:MAG: hypothetical protein GY810_08000 [Aureispira sp.]|nr:hypothetical protein [Aureispira sp.]